MKRVTDRYTYHMLLYRRLQTCNCLQLDPYLMVSHTLTPNQSLEEGGLITPSELILVRIPVAEGDQLLEASTTVATGIPQPSQPQHRRPPQHHAFVRAVTPHPRGLTLEVYPIVSFSREGGAVNGYNASSESVKQGLIPLPPLSSTFPTPPLFGTQLLIGGWINSKDAFLSVYPVRFELPRSSKVSIMFLVLCVTY